MPVGFRIASAWVDIRAEDKGLREQVKTAVEKAVKGQDAKINLKVDSKGLRREVQDALTEATKGQKPKIAIGIKSTGLRQEVTRALNAATAKQKPTVKLGISAVGLRGEVQRALTEATAGQRGTVTINTRVDTDGLRRALDDVDDVTIRPDVDLTYTRAKLRAAISGLREISDFTITPDLDMRAMRAKIAAEVATLRDKFKVQITPDLNINRFEGVLRAAAATLSHEDIEIDFNPRVNALKARAAAAAAFRNLQGKIVFDGELRTAMLALQIKAAQARLNAMPHNLNFRAKIDIDNAQVARKLAEINALLNNNGGHFGRWAKLAIAGALLIPPALSVVDAALRATGASLAVLVGYASIAITVFATMAIGMNNVVNAIVQSSESAKKYGEFLDQLTPSARQFVETVVNIKGVFKDLQATVQETMFRGLAKEIREMATVAIPSFTIGLGGMALSLNAMTKDLFKTTTSLVKMGTMDKMFGGMQLAMEPLVHIPGQFLNALVKLSTAAMPIIINMNKAFGSWADTMTTRLNNAFNDGTLQAGIQKAADKITGFFKAIANNPQFTEFMDRIKANGPKMAEIFGNISEAVMKIVNALAPVNGVIMTVVDAFARFINALPIEVLSIIITKLVLFKTALLISALVLKLSDAFIMLRGALLLLNNQSAMVGLIGTRMRAMGASAAAISRTATAMRALGKAVTGVLLITTILWVFDKLGDRAKGAAPDVDKLGVALQNLAITGKFTGELEKTFKDIDGFLDKLDMLNKKQDKKKEDDSSGAFGFRVPVLDDIGGYLAEKIKTMTEGKESLEALKDDFSSLDKAFAEMVTQGFGKLAAKDMKMLQDAWVKSGHSLKDFKEQFPDYKDALAAAKVAQEVAATSMGLFGEKANEVSDRIATLKSETDGLVKSLFELNGIQRDANAAVRDLKDSAEAMVKATKKESIGLEYKNGQLVQVTKAQRDAAAAIETHAANTEKAALATYTATGSWDKANKILVENKQKIIDQAKAAGMGTEQAKLYADSILKIPSKKEIQIMVADQATGQLADVTAAFRAAPGEKVIKVSALNTAAIQSLQQLGFKVRQLPDGQFEVTAKTAPAEKDLKRVEAFKISSKMVEVLANITSYTIDINEAQAKVDALKQKQATAVGADKKKLTKELEKAQKELDALKQKRAAEIKALDKTGEGVKKAKANLDSVKDKKVTISIATILSQSTQTTADAIRKQAEAQAAAAKKKKAFGGAIRRASGGGVGGGFVSGAGGPTADKIQALLSNGEYVIRASSVSKYGASMMGAINNGRFPKFAVGGPVTGGGGTGSTGAAGGTTTGTFTVTDATGKPVASALNNFKSLQDGAKKTYASINTDTNTFGKTLTSGVQGAGTKSVSSWNQWAAGMKSKTDSSYKGVKTLTAGFSRDQVSKTTGTKNSTQSIWTSWGSGMQSRTKATYGNINAATSSFSKQSVSKMGSARDGMGSAWGGLSPKFKPPVSYLVHSVINGGVVGSMNAIMQKLGGGKSISGISVPGFATGGAIYGAGSKTSDSIPARLSNGEFVMQAKAVDKFGTGFMNSLNSGTMPHDGAGFKPGFKLGGSIKIPGFAAGGQVGIPSADTLNKIMGDGGAADVKKMTDFIMNSYVLPLIDSGSGGSAMKEVQRAGMNHIRSNIESFVKENFGGAGSASAGLRWAKTQYGKPYQWGGNGNPSWDCSGFMSAIESVIRGESPHRRWATGSFSGSTAAPGWKLGAKAPFQIGVTNAGVGHTAGTIGKENVESSGGIGVHGGVGVSRGAHDSMFDGVYGYVGPNATKKASGGYISGPGGPRDDKIAAWLSNGEYVMRASTVKKFGTGYMNALNSGQVPGFAAGGSTTTSSSGTQYKIKYGDTLSEIAAKFGTTTKAIMALNSSIKDANKIQAGATIWIKKVATGGGGTTTPTTPPAFSLAAMSKVGKTGIQSTDGINDLKGFVTLSQASIEANKAGANIKDELINALKGQDSFATLTQNFYDLQTKIKTAFKGTAETQMLDRFNKVVGALTPLQKSLDGVNGKLETAQTALDDVKGKFDSLKDSVSGAIMDFGNITKIGKWGTNPQTIINQLQTDVTKAAAFGDQLKALKDKGINADLIGKIADAGIAGGGAATAASLLNMTPAQVAQLNALQAQLTTAANNAGTAAASGMYGAGVNAAQGLVDGLKSQQKAIQDQMLLIAAAMEKAIKQALGIKSPSRVMAKVGHFTADGLIQAVASRKAEANAAIRALVPAQRLAGSAPRMGSSLSSTGTMGSGSAVTNIGTINVNVTGSFDLTKTSDRRAIAKALVVEIKEEIRQDDKKRR